MSKKSIETPRKSPRLGEGTSNDDVHVTNFNILTQPPFPHLKLLKIREKTKKKKVIPANQKGKKRKGKIVETPSDSDFDFVTEIKKKKCRIGASSKPSTRRTTKSRYRLHMNYRLPITISR
ncbi:hypothetical protein H5410_033354 [Solanum commersonii]|uniref:Uncharacterized protein n=1 Tax=Solanum commersonii TaxID=4109 RepID=A0A9J5YQI9_SOLCO|nr:hypothetical protein H5410_033354 [Solanum commersonii]